MATAVVLLEFMAIIGVVLIAVLAAFEEISNVPTKTPVDAGVFNACC